MFYIHQHTEIALHSTHGSNFLVVVGVKVKHSGASLGIFKYPQRKPFETAKHELHLLLSQVDLVIIFVQVCVYENKVLCEQIQN